MSNIRRVATVILKKDGKILILKRSRRVGSFKGYWCGVSGTIKDGETPAEAAIRELKEETGINAGIKDLMPSDEPIIVRQGEDIWEVHPFLLEVKSKSISIDWEHESYKWINPDELNNYNFVPRLDDVVKSLLGKHANRSRNR